ncbi:Ubiquitin carboxyl-terminal hydrolase 22 [Thoreauomyces humboldtii]|nr:Ubiquitin carboxyl-terminal hydrolase 22 [Thoreauomyces humboldtii]
MPRPIVKPARRPSTNLKQQQHAAAHDVDLMCASPFGVHRAAHDAQFHGCPHLAAIKTLATPSASSFPPPANQLAPAAQELIANYRSCIRYSLSYRNRSQLHVNRKNKQFKIMCQLDDEEERVPVTENIKKRKRSLGWMDKEIHFVEKLPMPSCSLCSATGSVNRLHACLECVFLGCSQSPVGSAGVIKTDEPAGGKRLPPHVSHMQEHARDRAHAFSMDWLTCGVFCALCRDYVFDADLERMLQSEQERIDEMISKIKEPNVKRPRLASWIPSCMEVDAIQSGSTLAGCSALRGFLNLGNTCFMNAILQAMVHNPVLKFYFLSDKHSRLTCSKQDPHCMACHMDAVFQEFYAGDKKPYGPASFLHAMWMSQKQMAGYSQQDAHEFFISLANQMHNNCSSLLQSDVTCSHCNAVSTAYDPILDLSLEVKRRPTKAPTKKQNLEAAAAAGDPVSAATPVPPSPALPVPSNLSHPLPPKSEPLGGPPAVPRTHAAAIAVATAPSVVKAKMSKSRDPLDACTLLECLERYTVPEKLSEYTCGSCSKSHEATKQISVKLLPPILSIQLKRFEHSAKNQSSKIETVVKVPADLDMTPYTTRAIKLRSRLRPMSGSGAGAARKSSAGMSKGADGSTPMDGIPAHMYSLFAVISHTGKLETGHYTTYAGERDRWFAFDVHNVTLAKQKDVLEGNGYMCFYIRKGYQYPLSKRALPASLDSSPAASPSS